MTLQSRARAWVAAVLLGGASVAQAAAPLPAGNPLAGMPLFVDPYSQAALQAEAWRAARPADAAQLDKIAAHPQADWFGDWSGDIRAAVDRRVSEAAAAGALPVLVAYNVPNRDCTGHATGGAPDAAAYAAWIRQFALGIGGRRAAVILEPDALGLLHACSVPAERLALLTDAVRVLKAQPGTAVYLDAGSSEWMAPAEIIPRLAGAGIWEADGFVLNISVFNPTAGETLHGRAISAAFGGKHFIVDTSRNGLGNVTSERCNPDGMALGDPPRALRQRDDVLFAPVDAYLWVKRPGESDGPCNGGPAPGVFWPEYALGLARRATWTLGVQRPMVADARAAEGAAAELRFVVRFPIPPSVPVPVAYRTADGTAIAHVDYVPVDATVVVAAGTSQVVLTVPVLADQEVEADETLSLALDVTGVPSVIVARGAITDPVVNPMAAAPFYVDPYSPARLQADAWRATRPADAALLDRIAGRAQADWLGPWSGDIEAAVRGRVAAITAAGALPVLVAYAIPDRGCVTGGTAGFDAYRAWIADFAAGIGNDRAIVILEPYALPSAAGCALAADRAARLLLLRDAVTALEARPNVAVYVDAGSSQWLGAAQAAALLAEAGVAQAAGFTLNVGGFLTTASQVAYGEQVAALTGRRYVVDTSRNGRGPHATEGCNPPGRGLGEWPTAATGSPSADAFFWIKRPGESDGPCNGGPAAGVFWADYALELARNAVQGAALAPDALAPADVMTEAPRRRGGAERGTGARPRARARRG